MSVFAFGVSRKRLYTKNMTTPRRYLRTVRRFWSASLAADMEYRLNFAVAVDASVWLSYARTADLPDDAYLNATVAQYDAALEAAAAKHPNIHPFPSSVDVAHFRQARDTVKAYADRGVTIVLGGSSRELSRRPRGRGSPARVPEAWYSIQAEPER